MLMFSLYIMCFTYNLLYCYLFCKNVLKKDFHITKKLVLTSGIFAIFGCLNFYYNKTPLKPFVSHLIYLIVFKVYYKESWGKTLLGLAIAFIIVSIAELLFAFSAVNLFKFSPEYLNNTIHGLIFTNICILLVVISINNINKVKIVIKNVMGSFKDKSIATISIVLISSLSIGIFIIYQNFYVETSLSYLILINLFFLGVYVFMIGFFIEKSNNSNLVL